LKLCALGSVFERLRPVQKREAGVTANVIISLIDRMRKDSPQVSMRYSKIEANAHGVLGSIALDEGTEESAKRAVVHFENQLEVFEAIGNDLGDAFAKRNIAYAKSMYERGNNDEELLKANKELYKLRAPNMAKTQNTQLNRASIMLLTYIQPIVGMRQGLF